MNSPRRKILIVKTGQTELLTDELSGGPSLGDVFRTTCLLHEFSTDEVYWLTHPLALQLLPDDQTLFHAIEDSPENRKRLSAICFDLVINLERSPEICSWVFELMNTSDSKELRGFQPQEPSDHQQTRTSSTRTINIESLLFKLKPGDSSEIWEGSIPGVLDKSYQSYLFAAVGLDWKEQPYTLPKGVDISHQPKFTVGFNHAVGVKWPVKAWKHDNWQALAKLCEEAGISHSFQEGFDNLQGYFNWLLNHEVIITSDSLGLHLALAFKRRVIGIFGPTHATNVHYYNQGEAIAAKSDCPILPCFLHSCRFTKHCLENIPPEDVFAGLQRQLKICS